jgi:hypothetical protein
MANVEFDEDKFQYGGTQGNQRQTSSSSQMIYNIQSSNPTGMVGWLIKKGIVGSENTAQYVLVGVIIINIVIAFIVIKYFL